MRKARTLLILGVLVMIMPFSGFPAAWRTFFFFLIGLAMIYLSYIIYSQVKKNMPKEENRNKAFVDNIGSGE